MRYVCRCEFNQFSRSQTPRDQCRDSVEARRVQAERAWFKCRSGKGEKLCAREGSTRRPKVAILTLL